MTEHIDVEPGSMDALVGQAANEFLEELEHGGEPEIEEYLRRYPDIASVLREVLSVLEAMRPPREDPVEAVVGPGGRDRGLGRLGDFHILREIGRGGMGVVYEAEQLSLGRRVALKVLPAAAAMDAKRLQRFRNEAQAAAHLHHQNIVPVHAVGRFGSMHYYAMQYIEGQTLATLIRDLRRMNVRDIPTGLPCTTKPLECKGSNRQDRSGTSQDAVAEPQAGNTDATAPFFGEPEKFVPPEPDSTPNPSSALPSDSSTHSRQFFRTVARLGSQAADALEHAHSMGIVHRDIKPSNILLDLRGNLWITDFGLAHIHGDTQLTTTGDIIGTLRYMSPEQAFAQRGLLDQRTDVYSLGVTLYELATLEPAFNSEDRQELLHQIAFAEPKPPRKINRSVPRDLETILLKAIAKDPSGRYPTAQEMADDLRRFLADEPIQARRPTPLQKAAKWCRRHRAVVSTAAAVAAVSIVVVLAVLIRGEQREEKERIRAEVKRAEADQRREEAIQRLNLAWSTVDDMYVHAQKLLRYEPRMKDVQTDFLDKALNFYQGFVHETASDPDTRFRKAQAFHRIAEIQHQEGAHPSEDSLFCEGPAATKSKMAEQKLLDDSIESSKQAVTLLEQLVAESPDNSAYREELVRARVTRGRTLSGGNIMTANPPGPRQVQEAEQSYGAAATGFEELAKAFPNKLEYRAQVAYCQCAVAELQSKHNPTRFDVADRALTKARGILQELVDTTPKNVEYRNALASVYRQRGELMIFAGRPPEAEPLLRTAAKMLDQLSINYELLPESGYDMAQTYASLGFWLVNSNRHQEAEHAYQKSVDAGEKLVLNYPHVPRYEAGLSAALNGLAGVRHSEHKLVEARDLAKRALVHAEAARLASRDNFIYRLAIQGYAYFLGTVLLELNLYPEASEAAVRTADIIPTCPFGAQHAVELFSGCTEEAQFDSHLTASQRDAFIDGYSKSVPRLFERMHRNGRYDRNLQNDLAWRLATFPDARVRDSARAVNVAEHVIKWDGKTESQNWAYWNTLGVARYRNKDWNGTIAALEKSSKLNKGKEPLDALFMAMACWQLGDRRKAHELYESAVAQMNKEAKPSLELRRLRAEADTLLGKPESASVPDRMKR